MDLLRWIKREWDTSQSCKRRESEPTISANNLSSKSRDEAYVRALTKFNEWRHKERFGSFRRVSRRSSKKSCPAQLSGTSPYIMKTKTPESTNNNDDNHYEEIQTPKNGHQTPKNLLDSAKKLLYKRHSLPTNNNRAKKIKVPKCSRKCQAISENEVEEFENNHCKIDSEVNIDLEQVSRQSTPPMKFYKDNSNPFKEVKTPILNTPPSKYGSVRRLFENSTTGAANTSPPIAQELIMYSLPKDRRQNQSISTDNRTPKRYDFNPQSIYENEQKTNRPSQSPSYQTVVNKHGDLVEYALPFNDHSDEIFGALTHDHSKLKAVSTLNTMTVPCIEEEQGRYVDRRQSKSLTGLTNYAIQKPRRVIITDLDKSDGTARNETPQNEDIFEELNLLEKWSKSRSILLDTSLQKCNEFEYDLNKMDNNLIFCTIRDIRQRTSTLRSTMKTPISFSSGNFRKATVSLRKMEKRLGGEQQALLHDLFVLSKIKHPNVALLMAVCLDVNKKILSLLLEPFRSTMNGLIYETDNKLSIEDCIEYMLQIIRATMYLHENGIIHSNICSHNVLICDHKRNVKISSFELAAVTDEKKMKNEIIYKFYGSVENYTKSRLKSSFAKENWDVIISKNKFPAKYLPYLLDYRKLYSEHFYQAPELLSTTKHFVFPSKHADVYNIALLLWEMLNTCVPFAIFSYKEIENLFRLNEKTHLPIFEDERCDLFKNLLQNGLNLHPSQRIESAQSLKFLVEEAKTMRTLKGIALQDISNNDNSYSLFSRNESKYLSITADNEPSLDYESSPNNIQMEPHIYEKTSTLKKQKKFKKMTNRKQIESSYDIQKYLREETPPKQYNSRSLDDILKTNDTNEKKIDYEFQIEDFSLPITPIARNNKLRRTAWLSNKMISRKAHASFNEHDEEWINECNNKDGHNSVKHLNVNIKIIQNKIDKDLELSSLNDTIPKENINKNVSEHIEYWNMVTSPGPINLKKQNNNLMKTDETHFDKNSVKPEIISKSFTIPKSKQCKRIKKPIEDRSKYYPNMPELLSETFLRRSFNDDNDFESTLWKRERERCEQISPRREEEFNNINNGVIKPLRTSVKDAVHKFESFTKRDKSCRRFTSVDIRNNFLNTNSNKEDDLNDCIPSEQNVEAKGQSIGGSILEANLPTVIIEPDNSYVNEVTEVDTNAPCENISISKLNVQLMGKDLETSQPKQSKNSPIPNANHRNKVSHLSIPPLSPQLNNIQVRQNKTSVQLRKPKEKPMLFAVNLRKINRRASDIGCVRRNTTKREITRHSICGTDILKNMAKMSLMNNEGINTSKPILQRKSLKSITNLAEGEIQNCKLKCWKCGSKIFRVDETGVNERGDQAKGQFSRRFSNSPIPSGSSTSLSQRLYPNSSFEELRSTEDIYIDDDFGLDDETLGANIQLLPAEHSDIFDILSIDIFPTELFNQFE